MKYGPETETVEAFVRHLQWMTPEQWKAARDAAGVAARNAAWVAAWDAARNAAWDAAWDAARDAAWDGVGDAAWGVARVAANEIQGAALMRERGQPFYFLPLFGFDNPEAVLANNKETNDGV
jgi:hypothetical protein